jgi:O-antigen ligase
MQAINFLKENKISKIPLNTWINYFFIAYAFSIPVSKATTSLFEALIILFWVIQGDWKYKFSEYIKNPVILTLSIFIIYSLISLFWARDFLFGLEYIAKYRHFLLIPILYLSLEKKYVAHVISAFLMAMLLSEIVSYGIYFELWRYKDVLPSDPSPFMDHVAYSVYLSITAMILLNKVFFEEDKKYKIYYILFFVSVTINLFFNGGRTGQITFLIMLFVLFMLNVKHKIKAFFISVLLMSAILFTAFTLSPNFQERVEQAKSDIVLMIKENNYEGSLSIRLGLWIAGVDQITEKFDFGTGIGNDMKLVPYYAQKNSIHNDFNEFSDHHNMFITYAIQLGEVGLLIILVLFYFIFTLGVKNKMYKNINILFLTAFILWSFTGMTLHIMDSMTLFTLFVTLLNGVYLLEHKSKSNLSGKSI